MRNLIKKIKEYFYRQIKKLLFSKLEKELECEYSSEGDYYFTPYIGKTPVSFYKLSRYNLFLSFYLAMERVFPSSYRQNTIYGFSFSFDDTTEILTLNIQTTRPGLIIGSGGEDFDKLKNYLKDLLCYNNIEINLVEVTKDSVFAWTKEDY